MKKEAILHVPLSAYAYAVGDKDITVRIRCAKDDIKSCCVYFGDRVDTNPHVRMTAKNMDLVATDDLYDYFETIISDAYPRLCYYFWISDGTDRLYYNERGFNTEINENRTEYFQFPYIRREDRLRIPDWATDRIMYQIFPDSFADDKRHISGAGKEIMIDPDSDDTAVSRSKLGGTISGIEKNIDYIRGLGINCIYLNPIFMANSYHKYDTIDYKKIDGCFGDLKDLKKLVDTCHAAGIKVLLDGVFNHCGPDFFAFRDVLKFGKESKYFGWFYDLPDQVEYSDPPKYAAFAYVKEMPKLNTGNPEAADYLISVGTYWIKECGIDGWRLDVANEINHDFWRRYRNAIRAIRPDAFLIGEIWEDSQTWLEGDQFDSTMNYRFSYLCKDFFADRSLKASEFDEQIQKMIMRYPLPVSLVQMNFLDTHDVSRFLSYCKGDKKRLELAYFYLFMCVGIPSIFYGDEKYIEGVEEAEYRRPMPWKSDESFSELITALSEIRTEHVALRRGRYKKAIISDRDGIYGFIRSFKGDGDNACNGENILVVINNSDFPREICLGKERKKEKLYGSCRMNGELMSIDAMNGCIFVLK